MYNPTTRLLSILELLQSRGEVSGLEIAQILEVKLRSVRRYIMMLRDMGIPIEGERGRHGGYSLRPGYRMPPLMFNAEEITAVMLGLMLLRELGATALHPIESATAKMKRVLPEELAHSTAALRQALILDDIQYGTYPISSDHLTTFSVAIYEHKCLHIAYQSSAGDMTERLIAPYGLILHARTWYVPAYCFLRDDVRVFRLDRVQSVVTQSEQTFTPPADFDARTFVLNALAQIPRTYAFEVLLHVPLAVAQEVVSASMAVLQAAGDHQTLMRCYSDEVRWFALYLIQLELPFTVIQNDALRGTLRDIAQEILGGTAAYSSGTL